MFKEVIDVCNKFIVTNPHLNNVEDISKLLAEVNPYFLKIQVTSNKIPFGRYLIYMDKNQKFNIQIHVFSKNYKGSVHCHETWGIMAVLKGVISVSDWVELNNEWNCFRSSLFLPGTSTCFAPPAPDWHRTDTSGSNLQAISIHIYGKDWNMNQGTYLDDSFNKKVSKRGILQNNSQLLKHLTLI